MNRYITLQTPHGTLQGHLQRPELPQGILLLARSHHAPADIAITSDFVDRGYAVFAMELLTTQELQFADATQNVPRLSQRLIDVLDLVRNDGDMQELPLGIFANGDIVPAAIRAAAMRDRQVKALVCHGGLLDRAGAQSLDLVVAPLLVLFDADDTLGEIALQRARKHLSCELAMHRLTIGENPVEAANHWFSRHFSG